MRFKKNLVITTTPYRVSLFGGGTDLPEAYNLLPEGGAIVSFPIDKYITTVYVPRLDDKYRIGWSGEPELVDDVNDIQHDLVRGCMEYMKIKDGGIELTFTGHIPAGSGLSSSACVTVGTLHALYEMLGGRISQYDLANRAYIIERIAGKNCGKQDHFGCAMGGLKYIRFLYSGVDVHTIPLSDDDRRKLEESLYLYHTGIERDVSAEDSLQQQGQSAKQNVNHLLALKSIADRGYEALRTGDIDSVGELLDENWRHKRELGSVTNPVIDELYGVAKECGAKGGKICGAGLGGSFITYSSKSDFDELFIRRAREIGVNLKRIPFKINNEGSKVIHSE